MQNCALLLSEYFQDRARFGSVTVRSPFKVSISEAAAEYRSTPPKSRHPSRGRPRKIVRTRQAVA